MNEVLDWAGVESVEQVKQLLQPLLIVFHCEPGSCQMVLKTGDFALCFQALLMYDII